MSLRPSPSNHSSSLSKKVMLSIERSWSMVSETTSIRHADSGCLQNATRGGPLSLPRDTLEEEEDVCMSFF